VNSTSLANNANDFYSNTKQDISSFVDLFCLFGQQKLIGFGVDVRIHNVHLAI
jgi:hypothetical protein